MALLLFLYRSYRTATVYFYSRIFIYGESMKHWLKRGKKAAIHFFGNLSLKKKLFIMMICVSVIPITIIGIYSYSLSQDSVLKAKSAESQNLLKNIHSIVRSQIYDDLIYQSIEIARDENIVSFMERSVPADSHSYPQIQKLLITGTSNPYTNFLYLYGKNGLHFSRTEGIDSAISDIAASPSFSEFEQSPALTYYGPVIQIGQARYKTFAQKVFDNTNQKVTGYVFSGVNEKSVKRLVNENDSSAIGTIVLIDQDNSVFSSTQPGSTLALGSLISSIPADRPVSGRIIDFSGVKYLVNSNPDTNSNYGRYLSILPVSEATQTNSGIISLTFMLVLTIIFIVFLLAIILSNSFVNPIQKLAQLMQKAKLGKIQTLTPKYYDEMGYIMRCYNNMAEELNHQNYLLDEGRKKQRELELKAFEAQIKPHFLYNTLSTIIWLIDRGQNEKAAVMTHALSQMFRISTSRGNEVIPISKEMEHIKYYLDIQMIRYEGDFVYQFDVEEQINACLVIKMILQPLVENAIYHGVRGNDNGVIAIRGRLMGDHILLEVSDNGGNLAPEKMKEINHRLSHPSVQDARLGLGIVNVNDRIKCAYGDEYGLHYEIEESWTVISIRIPIVRGN